VASISGLDIYDEMVKEIVTSVGQAVGTHVLLLVIERSLWLTKHKYEEASRITYSEEGVSLQPLEEVEPERARLIAHTLVVTIVATLGRLIGKQLAQRMLEQLKLDIQEA
jgi:hypothetical protein